MILVRRPSPAAIARFIGSQKPLPFSYDAVGATRSTPPAGYTVDRHRVVLGRGAEAFRRASEALRGWRMFDLGWVELHGGSRPEPGLSVAVLVRWAGLWFLNASRVVYALDEEESRRRAGFAYGTLPEHAEMGEERWTVEWRDDDSVVYEILAFSRPRQMLARLGYPFTRRLQKRFARDSMAAMTRAADGPGV